MTLLCEPPSLREGAAVAVIITKSNFQFLGTEAPLCPPPGKGQMTEPPTYALGGLSLCMMMLLAYCPDRGAGTLPGRWEVTLNVLCIQGEGGCSSGLRRKSSEPSAEDSQFGKRGPWKGGMFYVVPSPKAQSFTHQWPPEPAEDPSLAAPQQRLPLTSGSGTQSLGVTIPLLLQGLKEVT